MDSDDQRARMASRAMFVAAVACAAPHRGLAAHLPTRPAVAQGGDRRQQVPHRPGCRLARLHMARLCIDLRAILIA